MAYDFIITGVDTDSIAFCKKDGAPFSEEERESLLEELNSVMPKGITFCEIGRAHV